MALCIVLAGTATALVVHGIAGSVAGLIVTAVALVLARDAKDQVPKGFGAVVCALAAMALLRAPIGSQDLWSYAFSGRALAVHHLNPYRTAPNALPRDFASVRAGWKGTPAVYGPLFTAIEAVIAWVAGGSALLLRLGFQMLAACSVLWSLRQVIRFGSPGCAVLLGLQPLVWISVVNGGHIDAVVAAFIVAAVVSMRAERSVRVIVFVSAAVLIKSVAVMAIAPLAVAFAMRRRWNLAVGVAFVPLAAMAVGEIAIRGSFLNGLRATGARVSAASVWRPVHALMSVPSGRIGSVGLLAVGALMGLVLLMGQRRDRRLRPGVGASLATLPMAAAYVLPWYAMCGIGVLAVEGEAALAALLTLRGATLAATYSATGPGLAMVFRGVVAAVTPLVLLVMFVRLVCRRAPTRPAPPDVVDLTVFSRSFEHVLE